MKKHLNLINSVLFISVAAFAFTGCSTEKEHKNFVARVNNTYLTRSRLDSMMESSGGRSQKEEVIRDWVNSELLYQEAKKEGILKEDAYKQIIENSKKELAAALLVQHLYKKQDVSYEPKDIQEYYDAHKEEFKLFYNAYLINRIDFNNEDDAIQFRSTVLESDWSKALNVFVGDTSIIKSGKNSLLYKYQISPEKLYKVVEELNPSEVSIVIEYNNDDYILVQLLNKFDKGTIPPLDVIKERVVKRFIANKKNKLLKNYINELYSNNDIEVKN